MQYSDAIPQCAKSLCVSCLLFVVLLPHNGMTQQRPSSSERSLYTSTSVMTVLMLSAAVAFQYIDQDSTLHVISVTSSCTSDLINLSLSSSQSQALLSYISLYPHGLAMDLAMRGGPHLTELINLLPLNTLSRAHLVDHHLSPPDTLIDVLYKGSPQEFLTALLHH